MVNSLCKVNFSHPTGHYKWKIPPPLEKTLGAPLVWSFVCLIMRLFIRLFVYLFCRPKAKTHNCQG